MSTSEEQKRYQKQKFGTHLDEDDTKKMTQLQRFLYKIDVLDRNSRYALVKYCLKWAFLEMIKNFPNYEEVIYDIGEQKEID